MSFVILDTAHEWGIPPWSVMSGAEPSDDDRRRWLIRTLIRRRLGG